MIKWQLSKRTKKTNDDERGITLFELLIVLAIIAFISTIIAPRVIGYLGRAKGDVARAQLANIAASMELYYLDNGSYPTANQGLDALVTQPDTASNWVGPYLKDASGLIDPWGQPYQHEIDQSGTSFRVYTLGRDGKKGGEGEDADIYKS